MVFWRERMKDVHSKCVLLCFHFMVAYSICSLYRYARVFSCRKRAKRSKRTSLSICYKLGSGFLCLGCWRVWIEVHVVQILRYFLSLKAFQEQHSKIITIKYKGLFKRRKLRDFITRNLHGHDTENCSCHEWSTCQLSSDVV